MPMYAYICPKCGDTQDKFFKHDENHFAICDCGEAMNKNYQEMLPAYHDVAFDSVDYDLTGEPIPYSTRGQLKAIAKQHGCRVEFGINRSHGHTKLGEG